MKSSAMKTWMFAALILSGCFAFAQEEQEAVEADLNAIELQAPTSGMDMNREPAAASLGAPSPAKAAQQTDDLRIAAQLPEAQLRKDARSLQNEVFKTMFNKELKPDQRDDALEE